MLHTNSIDGAADALYGPSHVIGWGRPSNTSRLTHSATLSVSFDENTNSSS
jgi:hypothetical protein